MLDTAASLKAAIIDLDVAIAAIDNVIDLRRLQHVRVPTLESSRASIDEYRTALRRDLHSRNVFAKGRDAVIGPTPIGGA